MSAVQRPMPTTLVSIARGVVVVRRGDRIEVQPAIEHVARQPDEVARLLAGLAGRAQALLADGDDRGRLDRAGRQDEPPARRFRRGERDLLLEDDPDEGLEAGLASPQRRRSVALGDAGQVGVDRGEGADGRRRGRPRRGGAASVAAG